MSEWIAALQEFFKAVWSYGGVQFICVGVILNFLLAVAVAVKSDNFSLRELGTFLYKQLLPYIVIYAGSALTTEGTDWAWIPGAVMVVITASIGSRIVTNLKDLGVPIPASIAKIADPPKQYLVITRSDEAEEDVSGNG